MDTDQRYDCLLDWASRNEAIIHPSLRFVQTESHGVECVVGEECESIKPGEVFMRIPYKLSFSYWNAVSAGKPESCYHHHESPSLPKQFLESSTDHETVTAVFLVQQYLLGEESFWYPYIQVLPRPDDLQDSAIPLLWSDKDLTYLRGTYLEDEVPKKRIDLLSRWSKALSVMAETGFDVSAYTS